MPLTKSKHFYIEENKKIYGGKPVIKGTRVPVLSIVNHYRSGMDIDEILNGYPNITPAQLFDALSYYFDHKKDIDKEFE